MQGVCDDCAPRAQALEIDLKPGEHLPWCLIAMHEWACKIAKEIDIEIQKRLSRDKDALQKIKNPRETR